MKKLGRWTRSGRAFTGTKESEGSRHLHGCCQRIYEENDPWHLSGHQCIGEALGGTVSYAKALFHGKQSLIEHDGSSVFTGINSPIRVARYHSLAVQEKDRRIVRGVRRGR